MKSLGKWIAATIAACGMVLASQAQATVLCSFYVTGVSIDTNGVMSVSFTNGTISPVWWLCAVTGTVTVNNGYTASAPINGDTCKTWYTQFVTARSSGRPVSIGFYGASLTDCGGSLPATYTWPSTSPSHIVF